ncbi:modular type I polyketide synthase [Methylocaldum marinum]|uniref:Modular type I polyketide synthase n=1 Tax=Methylocaldum marinum TaxID=1432792 RepID=A0A250KX13_9GAMM|nr:modular type I polyketide synthase [Methylocaldum marinum]
MRSKTAFRQSFDVCERAPDFEIDPERQVHAHREESLVSRVGNIENQSAVGFSLGQPRFAVWVAFEPDSIRGDSDITR